MDTQEYTGDQMQEYGGEGASNEKADHQMAVPTEPSSEEVVAPSNEEERLWGIVNANPSDFNSWTQLIQETEKLDDIVKFRHCYDTFLAEFPLCYGYWKKYADHENRIGTPEKVIEVYERAVKAVTYSVDIWVHYCAYATQARPEDPEELRSCHPDVFPPVESSHSTKRFESNGAATDTKALINTLGVVGRLFERGLTYVGTDYLAHQLWDKYIDFEYSHQNWMGISQLYRRILQIPLQVLDRYFTHFKELAKNRPLAELKSPDDVTDMEVEATEDKNAAKAETEESEGNQDPELLKFISRREALYKATKEWDAKIRDFEAAIRRPYFHVKPLDDMQLLNWHRYLDFLEKEADFEKVFKAYERCVIACANYPEYWIRYVHSMEAKGRIDLAENALERATHVFVKRRPEIHIYAARFKERKGDSAGARKEFTILSTEIAPGLLEVISKHANFEKRQGNVEGACAVYESALEVEKAKDDSRVLPFLYVQYIRFLNEAGLEDKSKQTQTLALEKLPYSKVVLEAAIHFESLSPGEKQIQKLDAIVERAIVADGPDVGLTTSDREEISNLFLEFLDFYGTLDDCKRAEMRHRQHFTYASRSAESKKRSLADTAMTDRSKLMKTGATTSVLPTAAAAGYSNGQASQWNYQGWQSSQSWNQAYPAGYNYTYSQYPQQSYTASYPQAYQQDSNWSTAW